MQLLRRLQQVSVLSILPLLIVPREYVYLFFLINHLTTLIRFLYSYCIAREAAATTYFPLVVALNLGYVFLRIIYQWNTITVYHVVITASLVGLSYISYKGILEDHANTIPKGKGKSDALAGGASLDLLGLVTVVQYGTVLFSEKIYWLLVIIPLWGGWKLYTTFFGGGSKVGGGNDGFMPNQMGSNVVNEDAGDPSSVEKANEKRQKRAERRRQKWS